MPDGKQWEGSFVQLLETLDKEHANGAAAISDITKAEALLQVQFPRSYREFLATVGSYWGPEDVYGIEHHTVPRDYSVVTLTLRERVEVEPRMPVRLVPFFADGFGNHFCLDTSQTRDDECPVIFWNHELPASQERVAIYKSFQEWFELYLLDVLEDET
jgi:cell wall assembly regulator SMI1